MITLYLLVTSVAGGDTPVRGMALGLHEGDDSYDYGRRIQQIKELGATDIALVFPYFMETIRSNRLHSHQGRTPSRDRLRKTIRQAHSEGLRVLMLPIILVEETGPRSWRGAIEPASPEEWWHSYRGMILYLAELAAVENVEFISIGSELLTREGEKERWRDLTREVRRRYRGRVIYSANWDHYRHVTFWDDLDGIGISGYFELTRDPRATQGDLNAAWIENRRVLMRWAAGIGKKLYFTEIGYPAIDGGAVYPWNYTRRGPEDEEEQARAYAAFTSTWGPGMREAPEGYGGVWFYEWGSRRGSTNYSPEGRRAEEIIRQYFR